jgi:hypothetical protein
MLAGLPQKGTRRRQATGGEANEWVAQRGAKNEGGTELRLRETEWGEVR